MKMNITLDTRQIDRAIKKVKKKFSDSTNLMMSVGNEEIRSAKRRIRTTKSGPDGRRWRRWSPATQESRSRQGTIGRGLLFNSGSLHQSFRLKVQKKKLEISNTRRFAGYLQFGTNNMPARPFLGWSKKSEQRIRSRFERNIRKNWK